MRRIATLGLFLLAGCNGGDSDAANNVAEAENAVVESGPMLGGVDLYRPIHIVGDDPEWEVELAPGTIHYSVSLGDVQSGQLYYVTPEVTADRAVYATRATSGEDAKLTLSARACRIGGEDGEEKPLTATLELGERLYTGCAERDDDGDAGDAEEPAAEASPAP